MDGIELVVAMVGLNSPFYVIVIHNAIQTRINKKLLQRLNDINKDEENEKEGKNADS